MATGKGVGGPKGKGGVDWSAGSRSSVVQRPNDSHSSDANLQKYLSVLLVVLFVVLMMLLPVLALMWGDLNAALHRANVATDYAISEGKKLKKVREEFLELMKGE